MLKFISGKLEISDIPTRRISFAPCGSFRGRIGILFTPPAATVLTRSGCKIANLLTKLLEAEKPFMKILFSMIISLSLRIFLECSTILINCKSTLASLPLLLRRVSLSSAMEDYPKTVLDFERHFATEESCHQYIFDLRWPDGFRCPRCGHEKAWVTSCCCITQKLVARYSPGLCQPSHLSYYLDEFTFRFNRRTSRSRGKLFYRLVKQAAIIEPIRGMDI